MNLVYHQPDYEFDDVLLYLMGFREFIGDKHAEIMGIPRGDHEIHRTAFSAVAERGTMVH